MEPSTVILTETEIGWVEMAWLDIMYHALPLKAGTSLTVPVFYPDNFQTANITINVSSNESEITAGGKTYTVFTCTVPELKSVHYVTSEGQLVKIENTEKNISVELVE